MGRSWLLGGVLLAACDGGGGAVDETTVVETAPFALRYCTDGLAGEPTCPINHVPLDELGVTGTITFVAEPFDRGLWLHDLHVSAGASGVYLEHPRVTGWADGGKLPSDGGPFRDLILAVTPHTTQFAAGTARFVDGSATQLSFEFAVLLPMQ